MSQDTTMFQSDGISADRINRFALNVLRDMALAATIEQRPFIIADVLDDALAKARDTAAEAHEKTLRFAAQMECARAEQDAADRQRAELHEAHPDLAEAERALVVAESRPFGVRNRDEIDRCYARIREVKRRIKAEHGVDA